MVYLSQYNKAQVLFMLDNYGIQTHTQNTYYLLNLLRQKKFYWNNLIFMLYVHRLARLVAGFIEASKQEIENIR